MVHSSLKIKTSCKLSKNSLLPTTTKDGLKTMLKLLMILLLDPKEPSPLLLLELKKFTLEWTSTTLECTLIIAKLQLPVFFLSH